MTDILFEADNRVLVLFDDGRQDQGSYRRDGARLTVTLERYGEDEVTGRLIGNRFLRLTHSWREDRRAPIRTETCDFERMFAPQT